MTARLGAFVLALALAVAVSAPAAADAPPRTDPGAYRDQPPLAFVSAGRVQILDGRGGAPIRVPSVDDACCVAFSPDSSYVAFQRGGETIHVQGSHIAVTADDASDTKSTTAALSLSWVTATVVPRAANATSMASPPPRSSVGLARSFPVEAFHSAVRWDRKGLYRSRWGNYDLTLSDGIVTCSESLPGADILASRLQGHDVSRSAFFDVVKQELGWPGSPGSDCNPVTRQCARPGVGHAPGLRTDRERLPRVYEG